MRVVVVGSSKVILISGYGDGKSIPDVDAVGLIVLSGDVSSGC